MSKVFGKIGNFFHRLSESFNKKIGKLSNRTREILTGLLFVSPWIIGFLLFGAYPIVFSFYMSLCKVEVPDGVVTTFIGLQNYREALTTHAEMITALGDFLKESLFMVFIINVFAILFAVILNSNIKGKGIFRTIW